MQGKHLKLSVHVIISYRRIFFPSKKSQLHRYKRIRSTFAVIATNISSQQVARHNGGEEVRLMLSATNDHASFGFRWPIQSCIKNTQNSLCQQVFSFIGSCNFMTFFFHRKLQTRFFHACLNIRPLFSPNKKQVVDGSYDRSYEVMSEFSLLFHDIKNKERKKERNRCFFVSAEVDQVVSRASLDRTCVSRNKKFHGACFSDHKCHESCSAQGYDDGYCYILFLFCVCSGPC